MRFYLGETLVSSLARHGYDMYVHMYVRTSTRLYVLRLAPYLRVRKLRSREPFRLVISTLRRRARNKRAPPSVPPRRRVGILLDRDRAATDATRRNAPPERGCVSIRRFFYCKKFFTEKVGQSL